GTLPDRVADAAPAGGRALAGVPPRRSAAVRAAGAGAGRARLAPGPAAAAVERPGAGQGPGGDRGPRVAEAGAGTSGGPPGGRAVGRAQRPEGGAVRRPVPAAVREGALRPADQLGAGLAGPVAGGGFLLGPLDGLAESAAAGPLHPATGSRRRPAVV